MVFPQLLLTDFVNSMMNPYALLLIMDRLS